MCMTARAQLWRTARLAPLAGLLLASGCLATLEQNLDYLLAPDALETTLFLPLAQFLLRLIT
jgi:hypothetical protein